VQSKQEVPVHLNKKDAALCWAWGSHIHKTLQVAYVTSVTCPCGGHFQLPTVTGSTIYSLWLHVHLHHTWPLVTCLLRSLPALVATVSKEHSLWLPPLTHIVFTNGAQW